MGKDVKNHRSIYYHNRACARVSAMVGNLLNQYVIKKKYGIEFDRIHTIKVAAFSAIAAMLTGQTLVYFSLANALVKMTVGGIVFLAACLILAPIFRAIVLNDIKVLRRILERVRFIYPIIKPFLAFEEKMIHYIHKPSLRSPTKLS